MSHLTLTKHGQRVFADAQQRAQATVDRFFGMLAPAELAVFGDILNRLVNGAMDADAS